MKVKLPVINQSDVLDMPRVSMRFPLEESEALPTLQVVLKECNDPLSL
jgi:hypothetical protein